METNPAAKRKRPVWVWIITAYSLFGVCYSLFQCYHFFLDKAISPGLYGTYQSWPFTTLSLVVLQSSAISIGAVLLFFLYKEAFYFFTVAAVVSVFKPIWLFTALPTLRRLHGTSLMIIIFSILIDISIWIAICFYIKKLEKKEILSPFKDFKSKVLKNMRNFWLGEKEENSKNGS